MKRCTFTKMYYKLAFLVLAGSLDSLSANPIGPAVVAGKANFQTNASTLTVTTGDRVVINWDSFSINKGEKTRFVQPGKDSAALNRVTGGSRSEIFGALDANGKVYLINPNGVLIDKDSQINAAAFLASTLDVSDSSFISNSDLLFTGNGTGTVVNLGTINAFDGDVILLGFQVDNQGKIIAPNGTAGLAAGEEILLQVGGDKKFLIRPKNEKVNSNATGVNMSGVIQALRAEIQADGSAYQLAINHTGMIDATNIVSKNGQVYLCAPGGDTFVNGKIHADDSIHILGHRVGVFEQAFIDTSSDQNGGNIWIGGGYQGSDSNVMNASQTYVSEGAYITSDAGTSGNAGQVIIWSDASTQFYGDITARGGSEKGDGGFVEVSGRNILEFNGTADRSATNGQNGSLLLDPYSIHINGTDLFGSHTTPSPFIPTASPSSISVATIATALATGDVTIATTADPGTGQGDIIWDPGFDLTPATNIGFTSSHTLTLDSYHDILMGSAYSNPGNGSVVFNAGNDITFENDTTTTSAFNGITLGGTGSIYLSGRNISALPSVVPFTLSNIGTPLNNIITVYASGDFNLQAGAFSAVVLGTNGVDFHVGNDLNIDGGTAANANASIFSTSGNMLFDVGRDVNLLAGTNNATFAQIGANVSGATSTISFTTIGGNLNLLSNLATGLTSNFAAIGHGNLGLVTPTVYSGDINISGSAGTTITLQGGTTAASANFAQIGHFGSTGTNSALTGNIAINGAGQGINLNPGDNYALIGLGGQNGSNTMLSGNVSIDLPGGNLYLNQGTAANSYAVVGPAQAATLQTGNVDVNLNGGNLLLQAGNLAPTTALIGFYNSGLNLPAASGEVTVNAGTIELIGGSAEGANALIGFANTGGILSNSTIKVESNNNILLQAGFATGITQIDAGNAIIGQQTAVADANRIDSILVTSDTGNITLIGGSALTPFNGVTLIGSQYSGTGAAPFNQPQSAVTVEAPNGTLALYGAPQSADTPTGGGSALIQTNAVNQPYDLVINAGDILLVGGNTAGTLGIAQISSPQNTSITTANNLVLNGIASPAQILTGSGLSTFTIAKDLILTGATQIGSQNTTLSPAHLVFTNVGGNVFVQAGNPDLTNAFIGHGGSTIAQTGIYQGNIIFDSIGGNVTLQGGSTTLAQIGHIGTSGSSNGITGDVILTKVDGEVSLTGGTGAGSSAIIGHGNGLAVNNLNPVSGTVSVNAASVELQGGNALNADAVIGFDYVNATPIINSNAVNVTSDNGISITAGNLCNAWIGYLNFAGTADNVTIQSIDVTANNGDITLVGGVAAGANGAALIGTLSESGVAQSNITITTPQSLQLIIPATSTGGSALIANCPAGVGAAFDVTIDPNSIILLSGTVAAPNLGNVAILSSGDLNLNFVDSLDINYDQANPTTIQTGSAIVRAFDSVFINTQQQSTGTINIVGASVAGSESLLYADTNDIIIGTDLYTGAGAINIGDTDQVQVAGINSGRNFIANIVGPFNIEGGNANTSVAFLSAGGNIDLVSAQDITLTNPSATGVVNLFADGFVDITSTFGNVNIGTNSNIQSEGTTNGNVNINASQTIALAGLGSFIQNLGTGDITLQARTDVTLATAADIFGGSSGDLNINAGRDLTLTGASSLTTGGDINTNTGRDTLITNSFVTQNLGNDSGISMNSGRDITITSTIGGPSSITQTGTGDTNFLANQDFSLNGASTITTNGVRTSISAARDVSINSSTITQTVAAGGLFNAVAGEDLNIINGALLTTNAEVATLTAGQDVNINGSTITHTGTSTFTVTSGEDLNVIGSAVTTSANVAALTAPQDINVTTASVLIQSGTSQFNLSAGEDVNFTDSSIIDTTADNATLHAGDDLTITSSALFNQTGTSQLRVSAGEDLIITNLGSIITTAATANFVIGQDAMINSTGSISDLGTDSFNLAAGNSLILQTGGIITTNADVANLTAGQDVTLTDDSSILHTGAESFNLAAGKNLTVSDTSFLGTFAEDATLSAGQDATFDGTSAGFEQLGTENFSLTAGNNVTIINSSSLVTSADDATIDAGQTIALGGTSSFLQTGSSKFNFNAGEDVSTADTAAINTNADSAKVTAGQDITMSDGSTFIQSGTSDFNFTAAEDVTTSGTSAIESAAMDASVDAGQSISMDGSGFLQTGTSKFNFTAGEDISVNDGSILTEAKDVSFIATDDISFTGSTVVSQPGMNSLLFMAGGNLDFLGTTGVTTAANKLTLTSGLDTLIGDNAFINQTGESSLSVNAGENFILTSNGRLTTNAEKALFNVNIDQSMDGNAEINFNSDGEQTYNIGLDLIMHDNSFISTINGSSHFNVARDVEMTGRSKILTFGSRRLEVHAGNDINLSDHAQIMTFGGELLTTSDYNTTLSDFAEINNTFGNVTVVVDNAFPNPPFFGDGSFKLLDDSEINAPNGTIRIFTSRRVFNEIDGTLNGHHFHPGTLYVDTHREQWHTYFNTAVKGVPYTIFYKDFGTPVFPPTPLSPRLLQQFYASISEGFQDWRYYDQFDYETLYLNVYDNCYTQNDQCDDTDPDVTTFKLLREVFHNRHTIKYNLPF